MRKIQNKSLLFLMLLWMIVWIPVEVKAESTEEENIQILFVGNSYTYRNHMSRMFQKMTKAGGYDLYAETVWVNGATLEDHLNPAKLAGKVFQRTLHSRNWDYVILQEMSLRPLKRPAAFQRDVTVLTEQIRESGAEVLLNMTWARKSGDAFYKTKFAREQGLKTPKKMQKRLYDEYTEAGYKNDVMVVNTGVAFLRCIQGKKQIELYSRDKSHPSRAGSYLMACTLYAAIFQEEVPKKNLGIPGKQAETLRKIAEKVTFTSAGILS